MKELSLHILDLVQNSVHASATEVKIDIVENTEADTYDIRIGDNGKGMGKETLARVLDPFFTTKSKKTGLGIPLLKQHAEMTGGDMQIQSQPGKGTVVIAHFIRSSIDRQPLGDMAGTMSGLIRAYADVDFKYAHCVDGEEFVFSTVEIAEELDGVPLQTAEVINFINEMIASNLEALGVA